MCVLPFSCDTDTRDFVLVRSMVVLYSDLVKGEVALKLRPALLVEGVHVILGNELTGGQIWADSGPSPVITCSPSVDEVEEKDYSQIFPACAVTRAQA